MRIFLIFNNDRAIEAYTDEGMTHTRLNCIHMEVARNPSRFIGVCYHSKEVELTTNNDQLIVATLCNMVGPGAPAQEYFTRVLNALIGKPKQCPSCRCYDLTDTVDHQWCCANCKRTMLDCIKEGLLK